MLNGATRVPLKSELCSTYPGSYCSNTSGYGVASLGGGGCSINALMPPGECILTALTAAAASAMPAGWTQPSARLTLRSNARLALRQFLPYLTITAVAVDDPSLSQETELINKLIGWTG